MAPQGIYLLNNIKRETLTSESMVYNLVDEKHFHKIIFKCNLKILMHLNLNTF